MSHSIRKVNLGNSAIAEITIIDYVNGGETFTLAEFGLTGSVTAVSLFTMLAVTGANTSNRYGLSLAGANLKLMESVTSFATEAPTTVGLNFSFVALIHGA